MNLYHKAKQWFRGDRQTSLTSTVIARAMSFYNGTKAGELKVRSGVDDNVYINYAKVIVDAGVEFLFGSPLKLSVGTDKDKSGEDYLEKVWPQSQRDEEFQEMAQDAATAGDAYLKIHINSDGTPGVAVGDPDNYRIITDPHNVSRITGFVCAYQIKGEDGKDILFKEETTRDESGKTWSIKQYTSSDGGRTWQPTGEDKTWNFSFPPIIHAKNLPRPKSVYGEPDLTEPVLKVIGYISRLDSMCGKVVRVHSTPKAWAKGVKSSDLDWSTDGMLYLGSGITQGQSTVEAEIGLLEMKGDLSGALSYRKVLREGLAEMTGVPEVATGKVETTGNLSGVALRILYSPLISKTKKKQLRFGRLIKETATALLAIGHVAGAVSLHWSDPLPGDEKEKVEVAEGKKRLGFSEQTLIRGLGGDPEKERKLRDLDSTDTATELLTAFERGTGVENVPTAPTSADADDIAKRATAAGALIRSGFEAAAALVAVGLDPIKHLGRLPVTLQGE